MNSAGHHDQAQTGHRIADHERSEAILRVQQAPQQTHFLELFFDLILVFALSGVVSRIVPTLLSDSMVERWKSLGYVLVLALPLIWLWTTTAQMTSRFDPSRPDIQVLVITSAFGLLIMSTSLPYAFVERGFAYALPYVLLQVGRPLYLLVALRGHPLRVLYARWVVWSSVSAVPWLAGGFVYRDSRVALWALAVLIDYGSVRLNWPVPRLGGREISAWAIGSGHHLAERYRQFLMIALGETVLAVGITYTAGPASLSRTLALVVAFLSTVLMWRIYFYRAGQVLADALAAAPDRAKAARAVGMAHVLMVLGIVTVATGHGVVQHQPTGEPQPAWLAAILGGPAVFLYGRIRLERAVFNRLSIRRVVATAILLSLAVPLAFTTPLVAATAAVAVLLGIAIADAQLAAGRPLEAPSPPA